MILGIEKNIVNPDPLKHRSSINQLKHYCAYNKNSSWVGLQGLIAIMIFIYKIFSLLLQGRRNRSGQSGHGLASFSSSILKSC